MEQIAHKDLLDAGVHFGHLRKKWNPKMLPYIFMEKKGIHIINLNKTHEKLLEAAAAVRSIARSGKKILFVATKKQAKEIIESSAARVNMPFVSERWLGGMMTNFATIKRSIRKMQTIDKMLSDDSYEGITKKEKLVLAREREKLERVLGGIAQLNRLPSAIFIVDITHEHIALKEAQKLNMTTFGMVDTNSDPTIVDFPIPANDDASKSIAIITKFMTDAIAEGLDARKQDKADMDNKANAEKELKKAEKEEKEAKAKEEKEAKAKEAEAAPVEGAEATEEKSAE